MQGDFGINQGLVEELYLQYRNNPGSVEDVWRKFFDGLSEADQAALLEGEGAPPSTYTSSYTSSHANSHVSSHAQANGYSAPAAPEGQPMTRSSIPANKNFDHLLANELQGRVSALVHAYRTRGHLFANLDPLGLQEKPVAELSLKQFGLDGVDPNTVFATTMAGASALTLKALVQQLEETYCRSIGVEFSEIENPAARAWLEERMESTHNRSALSREDQLLILKKLTEAEAFEQFVHTHYVGAKRFSLEGGEALIPCLELLMERSAAFGVEEIVMGMAHRGRLNVLVNFLEKQYREIFFAFEDNRPEMNLGRGDVKYHLGYSSDRQTRGAHNVHLTMCFNPSHLEFVNAVVEGRARAKQDRKHDVLRQKVLPVQIHGDAAMMGQGIVAETLNLCKLEGYATGGTVHIVVNNQVGFTTNTKDSRSTRYCTDVARIIRAPVFHVNGEDPEAVAHVAWLASEYRQKFGDDVVIDLYCYRRYGHNEADEPRFTQPVMYSAIDKRPGVRQAYIDHLKRFGTLTDEDAAGLAAETKAKLDSAFEGAREKDYTPPAYTGQGVWTGYSGGDDSKTPDVPTSVDKATLSTLLTHINEVPAGFKPNPKVQKLLEDRRARAADKPLDWGTGELLAYASLLNDGTSVRLSGQDSRRGTFSHRHATIYDTQTGQDYTPLAKIFEHKAKFEVIDSPLSEAGVLGFDYGYSLDMPDSLVIWEAQFGDFANGAQVIIDQFITSSEDKWHRLSGLVMLLPHGFEGQGPEHSSARLERFLTACAEDNIQVCNLTTPAQLFHCFRRQVKRPWRKPLVIMSPKSLLRHPKAVSTIDEVANGSFSRVLTDATVNAADVKRVLMCTGKVYYDLLAAREEKKRNDIALVRFEQLYPLRQSDVQQALAPFANAEFVWVQEEPENMGAGRFMSFYLPEVMRANFGFRRVCRPASASPATGSHSAHKVEQNTILAEAFDK